VNAEKFTTGFSPPFGSSRSRQLSRAICSDYPFVFLSRGREIESTVSKSGISPKILIRLVMRVTNTPVFDSELAECHSTLATVIESLIFLRQINRD